MSKKKKKYLKVGDVIEIRDTEYMPGRYSEYAMVSRHVIEKIKGYRAIARRRVFSKVINWNIYVREYGKRLEPPYKARLLID